MIHHQTDEHRGQQQRHQRPQQAQKPHEGTVLPAHIAVVRRVEQVPQADGKGQRPGASVQQQNGLSLHQEADRPVRPLRAHHLRQGRVGVVLDELLQCAGGQHVIQLHAVQPPLKLLHRLPGAHAVQIAKRHLPRRFRAHLPKLADEVRRWQPPVQQRQVIPQGLVKRVMGPHHHRFVSGVGDGPAGIGAQVDPQGLIAGIHQHQTQAPEQILHGFGKLLLRLHLRHGQHILHHLFCGASPCQHQRTVHHGPKDMLGHLLPVGKSLHVQ